jgi:RNA polymerase sigma factor (sigma-70 family)
MDLDELARAAQTDPAAAELLFERLRLELSGFVARRFGLPMPAVDDVVQNALLVVHRKLDRFESRGPGSMLSWVRKIALYEALRELRRHARMPRPLGSWEHGSPETGLSSQVFRAQLVTLLRAEARELPSYERRAIEAEFDDGDLGEFAAREQVSRSAARAIRWRARKRLGVRVLERLGLKVSVSASSSTPAT